MIPVQVNNSNYLVNPNLSIIESCKFIGIILPRFCYHEKLSVAANCRMCLVEIDKISKPITACSAFFLANAIVYTNTPLLKKARENVIEALLLNHPLDCPICDQAGECDLQDQVTQFGSSQSRIYAQKKQVTSNKNCGPVVKTIMTRCIHCTRCIRFSTEIAGVEILGTLNRGGSTEIGTYITKLFHSEISGNVIDLCPVGALTANFYSFELRPWELYAVQTIDLSDSFGSNIYIYYNGFENKTVENSTVVKSFFDLYNEPNFQTRSVARVLPKINEDINGNWISDRARFSFDSLKQNRLHKEIQPLEYSKKLALSNIKQSINSFEILTKFSAAFFIDENVDLETLTVLTKLKQKHSKVGLFSVDKPINLFNYHVFWSFDKVSRLNSNVRYCFLFASNIKTESIILSTKLKSKSLNNQINFIGMGLFSNQNSFSISFINLTLYNIFNFIEGKDSNYSKSVISNISSVFCFGESFISRSNSSYSLILNELQLRYPNSIFYQVNKKSNTSSFNFTNIRQLTNRSLERFTNKFFYNLDLNLQINTLLSRLYYKPINKKQSAIIYWFNSHNPMENIFFENIHLIPSLASIESVGTYINLEERPQKNCQLSVHFKSPLKDFLYSNTHLKSLSFSSSSKIKELCFVIPYHSGYISMANEFPDFIFISEFVENHKLFKYIKKNFSQLLIMTPPKTFGISFRYPFKSAVIDVYTLNSYLKNSPRMRECSRELRKISNNFY